MDHLCAHPTTPNYNNMKEVCKIDLGVTPYAEALELQRVYFERVIGGERSVIITVEHPHVYTLGKSGDAHNLLINDTFLKAIGAEYFPTDRGGDITYHGYGQLVVYPILNLTELGISLRTYVELLEEATILTVAEYGIRAGRVKSATGVWIDGDSPTKARKIAAIGVKASRGVTMHGIAINVTTDLSYFSHINPCGMADKGVSSLKNEGVETTLEEIKSRWMAHFGSLLNINLVEDNASTH